jgi:drug/metabolite transporter (DMT)-like permease
MAAKMEERERGVADMAVRESDERRRSRMNLHAFGLLLIAILLSTFGEVLLKAGVDRIEKITLEPATLVRAFLQWQVLAGFVLLFGGSLFWLAVLSRVHLSIAYPLLAIGYILTTIWALVFLKEPVPLSRWVGIGAICGGIVLVLYKG